MKVYERDYKIIGIGSIPRPEIEKNNLWIERNGKRVDLNLGEVLDSYFSLQDFKEEMNELDKEFSASLKIELENRERLVEENKKIRQEYLSEKEKK